MSKVLNLNPHDRIWNSALTKLQKLKYGYFNTGYTDILNSLSKYIKTEYRLNNFNLSSNFSASNGVVKNELFPLPFVNCAEAWLSSEKYMKCFEKFETINERPFNTVFLGDSRTRFLMRYFLKMLETSLDIDSHRRKKLNVFYREKIKWDWNMSFKLLNVTLKWAPYLDENKDSMLLIDSWCHVDSERPPKVPMPDLLVISYGAWTSTHKDAIDGLTDYYDAIRKISTCLTVISRTVPVIWMVQPPMKVMVYPNPPLDITNSMAQHVFRDSNVWLWDTATVVAIKEINMCYSFILPQLYHATPYDWGCWDIHHGGRWAYTRASNMLLNLMCNRLVGVSSTNCCY